MTFASMLEQQHSAAFVLPHPLSQPPTLSAYLSHSPHFRYPPLPDAFPPPPTPPRSSTFARMRHMQSLASHDVSLGLRYIPPAAAPPPLPPPVSPALSAILPSPLNSSAYSYYHHSSSSHSMSASPVIAASSPQRQYSLFSSYPGVAVVAHNNSHIAAQQRAGVEKERNKREEAKQRAEEKKKEEEQRRKRQEASRLRRIEQLKQARDRREREAAQAAEEERQSEEEDINYPSLAEVMPPRHQPSHVKRRSDGDSSASQRSVGGRAVSRGWVDVSEAEIAQQKRAEDERLKEEKRLKQMQEKISLLKAKMGLREHSSASTASPAAHPPSASRFHTRVPLTFSASPYAPLSAARRPSASPARIRSSSQLFASPRQRPHPFLRHSPVRRRRMSLSPKKQGRRADGQPQSSQQQHQLATNTDRRNEAHSPTRNRPSDNTRHPHTPNKQQTTHTAAGPGVVSRDVKDDVNDVVSSTNMSSYLHSLVEAEISRHIYSLTVAPQPQPPPPSPPLFIPRMPAPTASLPSLQQFTSLYAVEHMDSLVADVLDRLVADTVGELNSAEKWQRASVVLDEVDDMVSELERLEDSAAQRWLGDKTAQQRQEVESPERQHVHDDIVVSPVDVTPAAAIMPNISTSSLPAVSLNSAASSSHRAASRPAQFHPRVLPPCDDVSPQLMDPSGVSAAERWCDEWLDEAVSVVVNEMWQSLDAAVDDMLEQEVA